jgi:hypothetical protein
MRRYHYVQAQVKLGYVKMHYIPTEFMLADPLTKNLTATDATMINFRKATEVVVTP